MTPLTFDELFRLASVDCGEASILAQEALRIMVRYTLPQNKPEPPDEECGPDEGDEPVHYLDKNPRDGLSWGQLNEILKATERKVISLEANLRDVEHKVLKYEKWIDVHYPGRQP